ncbi:MAG TPA: MFS transporter [Lentisphaeria bacterium]|nr:MAG: MFS transporter [Lentisphaerae bacterium GWF2_38_69]HBM16107.1 MFS transporter [Lentisphaeria bacterium]
MSSDFRILFFTRIIRLFAYGFLSVALALYLSAIGMTNFEIGLLLSLTLLGDVFVSMWITIVADRVGRKRMLILGSLLMAGAGVVFIFSVNPIILTLAAIIGIISPSGNEIGPFLSIEQASLAQIVPNEKRTWIFSWYNLAGSFATAAGALCSGWIVFVLKEIGIGEISSYRAVLFTYAIAGIVLMFLFVKLSPNTETPKRERIKTDSEALQLRFGLHRSKKIVMKLSALFTLDSFAGGFVIQSLMVYWFNIRFGADITILGSVFFAANLLAGVSALMAARIAKWIGLVNTMVFTHIPSNILLILIPLMPNFTLAVILLLLRFSISQMDVPARQSYTMAVVDSDERTAASGITNTIRSIGASLSPVLVGLFLSNPALLCLPFFFAGGLKIVYDLAFFRVFRHIRPPEEENRNKRNL